jgi:organizing structure protein 2
VARARLLLHDNAARVEDSANALAARAFSLEHSLTATIVGLAPSRQSGEKVLPGAIYVLVSAMGATVLTRNRNVLLRASMPVLVGLGAAQYLLPVTMRNVGDLAWSYEKRWPALADAHLRTRERVERFVSTGVAHSKMGVVMLEDKIGEARHKVEGWVSKGR